MAYNREKSVDYSQGYVIVREYALPSEFSSLDYVEITNMGVKTFRSCLRNLKGGSDFFGYAVAELNNTPSTPRRDSIELGTTNMDLSGLLENMSQFFETTYGLVFHR